MHAAIYDHMVRKAPAWQVPEWYHVGDRVVWDGMLLVCGIDHYAGGAATDPWDPGWGWGARRQARLWQVVTREAVG